MKLAAFGIALAILVGCGSDTSRPQTTGGAIAGLDLPVMKTFAPSRPSTPSQTNSILARDILDLMFQVENGATLPVFSRFEGPIRLRVATGAPPTLGPDLDRLLDRLRREARIDIRRVSTNAAAEITVHPIRRAQIQRLDPTAACFARPNVDNWADYRARRRAADTNWSQLRARTKMAVFVPSDVGPQEIRDCLHEEIALALGPVNDFYRLAQSVHNDDGFQSVLTGYDMLVLRAVYDTSLRTGMSQTEVAARLPAVLSRLNPRGGLTRLPPATRENTDWRRAIVQASTPGGNRTRRLSAARRAVALAQGFGGNDIRLAYSHYVHGRLAVVQNRSVALQAFNAAGRIYRSRPDTTIHEAHVAMQIAAIQMSAGNARDALELIDRSLDVATRFEHAALLSLMLLIKSEALVSLNRPNDADAAQTEALAWARYGFGDTDVIQARVSEIRAMRPTTRQDPPS